MKVESAYTRFFGYADRDMNDILTKAEVEHISNRAWKDEWDKLFKLFPEEVKTKLDGAGIPTIDFMEMSMPGGIKILYRYE